MSVTGPDTAAARALAEALDLLAEAFLVPGADVRGRAAALAARAEMAAPGLADTAAALREIARTPTGELAIEFTRLFLTGRTPTAHPYESFYRSGRLADADCLSELGALYEGAGVQPNAALAAAPDHLGAELDLLALALSGLATADVRSEAFTGLAELAARLVDDHLTPFLAAFAARLADAAPPPYYAAAARAAAVAVAAAGTLIAGAVRDDRNESFTEIRKTTCSVPPGGGERRM